MAVLPNLPQPTPGSAAQLLEQGEGARGCALQPVLTVADKKLFGQRSQADQGVRYLMVLSDGAGNVVAMVVPTILEACQGPRPLEMGSLIQVLAWERQDMKGKSVVFVKEFVHLACHDPARGLIPLAPARPAGRAESPVESEMLQFLSSQAAPAPAVSAQPEMQRFMHPQAQQPAPAGAGFQAASVPPAGYGGLPQGSAAAAFGAFPSGSGSGQNPTQAPWGAAPPPAAAPPMQSAANPYGAGSFAQASSQRAPPPYGGAAPRPAAQQPPQQQGQPQGGGLQQQQPWQQPWQQGQQQAAPQAAGGMGAPQASWPPPPMQQQQQQPRGPAAYPGAPAANQQQQQQQQETLVPIAELNVYSHVKWRLEARVVKKDVAIRTFKYRSREGDGQMFAIELLDRSGSETRCTFFGDCEQFHRLLREGSMYSFSKGKLKRADPKWYTRGAVEITFGEDARVQEIQDDDSCARNNFSLHTISDLSTKPANTEVDLVAVVIALDMARDVPLRKGGKKARRDITLLDDSGASVKITFWGDQATDNRMRDGALLLIKSVKVSDYGGGFSLSASFGTSLYFDADAEAAHARCRALRQWFAEKGPAARASCKALSDAVGGQPVTLQELQEEAKALEVQGPLDTPAGDPSQLQKYHTVSPVTVTVINQERAPFYLACTEQVPLPENPGQTRSCNKKVEGGLCGAGHHCERPAARWMTSFAVADHSGSQYVSGFDESLMKVFGCPAQNMADLWDRRGEPGVSDQIDGMFKSRFFTMWTMRLRSKKEFWNDEERLKVNIIEAVRLNHVQTGRQKLKEVLFSLSSMSRSSAGGA